MTNSSKRRKTTTRRVTPLHAVTVGRRYHRSPRKLMALLREQSAEGLTAQREAFRNNRRQARAERRGVSPEFIQLAKAVGVTK